MKNRLLLLVLLLAALPAYAGLQLSPVALETGENAAQPAVAVDPREGFVVTWQERGKQFSQLKFAVIAANGRVVREGLIAQGTDWFINGADFPNLAVLDNGDWLTFWLQKSAPGTYSYEIRALRSRDAGKTWEAPITVHRDGTATEHGFVAMTPAGGDRVQLVWLDGRRMAKVAEQAEPDEASEQMTLRAAVLGRDGKLREERELDQLSCSCCQTDAVRGANRTLVAYRDRSASEVRDISTLVHDRQGWSKPKLVHADGWKISGCPVNGPALADLAENFAVLWPTMAGDTMQLRLAFGDGLRFGSPKLLASGPSELGRVDLSSWGEHGLLASRVRQAAQGTELVVDELDERGTSLHSYPVASQVGGYPRMARFGEVALLVWAEAGGQSSRLGLRRIQRNRILSKQAQ